MPGVRDCAVFGIPDEEFGEALAARGADRRPARRCKREEVQNYPAGENRRSYKVPRVVDVPRRAAARGKRQDLQAAPAGALLGKDRAPDLERGAAEEELADPRVGEQVARAPPACACGRARAPRRSRRSRARAWRSARPSGSTRPARAGPAGSRRSPAPGSGERPIDGSSISISLGSSSRPRAISSSFCWPPESVEAWARALLAQHREALHHRLDAPGDVGPARRRRSRRARGCAARYSSGKMLRPCGT